MADATGQFLLQGGRLPPDALAVRYRAVERVSEPFLVDVDFTTAAPGFDVATLLRTQVTLRVIDATGAARSFDGVVARASFVDVTASRLVFRVRLRPALAALTHRQGCRIWQEKTIVQVVQSIFDEAGFGDRVDWRNKKPYAPHTFIVQYRESELDFVHRWFERYGLFYYFSHGEDGHRMVIGDDPSSFEPRDGAPPTRFAMTQGVDLGAEPLAKFRRRRSLRARSAMLLDYDFEKPQVPPRAVHPPENPSAPGHFDYPGGFTTGTLGGQLVDARLRGLRADADVVEGESRAISLRCGVPFAVAGATEADCNGSFVVTELITTGEQQSDRGSVAAKNRFSGIPADAPFGPPRKTPWPRITGVQTAIVTGSSSQAQALHVDEHARIKVRFHWDREGQRDHTSSAWIRVAQLGLGGSVILPRIGWEVTVAFLDGDPDRPLVLGRVYNGEHVPPQALPGAKASGALKSWSSPGGGGYNEISLSDQADGQGFSVHAQKDFNVTVGNDKTESVAVDEEDHVSVNGSSSVGVDETISVGGNQAVSIGANRTHHVGGGQSISVGGNDTSNATCDMTEKISGDRDYTVGGNFINISNGLRYEVTKDITRSVASAQINGSIASLADEVAGNYTHSAGAVTVHLVNGSHGENIAGAKTQTSMAAEVHLTKANLAHTGGATVTNMIGGLHYQKLGGDLIVKAPMVTLLGGVGVFKGGGSEVKLGGGPIVIDGKKISVKGAMVVKMGGQLKMA
ncbi:MAG: type VI secretion system tip protein TssI/VgrG [Myxococcota bacterium]